MKSSKRSSRVVYGVYVLVVAAFVVSNIAQVSTTLFASTAITESTATSALDPACAQRAAAAIKAIDAARAVAVTETDVEAARATYAREREAALARAGLGGQAEFERACQRDPRGLDTVAAVTRFDRVSESAAARMTDQLSPVRSSARSSISGDIR